MTDTFDNRYRSAWCGQVRAEQVGDELRVAGWVHRRRDHGGLIFIDLRDREGLLQLVFHPEDAKEAHAAAGRLRAEDVVSAAGKVVRREEGTVNPNLPTGEVELAVSQFDLLADADTPPFQIDEDDAVSEELRLRYRYLDLRKPAMSEAIALRARVVSAIRRRLDGEGFIEVETPTLTRSTPEGARDYLVPSRIAPGSLYALPQSPQIFKQLLMIGGFERYYQIARCYRDESARADRLPEFTQLDVEMSFVEEDDVIATVDPLLSEVLAEGGVEVPGQIERITYDDAMLRYGTDRPDRRIPIEIADLGEVFAASQFKVFAGALADGGVVRGFSASGEFPRSRFDALTERAQRFGAKGLVWGVVEPDGWRSPVAKFLSEEEIAGLIARHRRTGGRRHPRGGRRGAHRRARAGRPAPGGGGAAWTATTSSGWWTSRCSAGTRSRGAGTPCTIRSPPPAATSTAIRAPGAAAPTTSCGTEPRSAVDRSASPRPRCSRRSSPRSG